MTLKSHACIRGRHTFAIVGNLNQRPAGIPHLDIYLRSTGIGGIFHQFLNHRAGALNDLACSYLIGYGVGEKFNYVGHNWSVEAVVFLVGLVNFR